MPPATVLTHTLPSGQTLVLEHGDLTEAAVEAIVNAANAQLAHGGGVAGAIVRRGGPSIQAESDAWVAAHGPVTHERPALTGAGTLPARAIIHAVGPVWRGGDDGEPGHLRHAYLGALELAHAQGFRSIAFPSISTGIFGYPVEQGAHIALQAAVDFCAQQPASPLREIRFTLIDERTLNEFRTAFERHMGGQSPSTD